MKFTFFKIGIPKSVSWEELSKNIMDSIEMERQQNIPPSVEGISSERPESNDIRMQNKANTSIHSNFGTATDDVFHMGRPGKSTGAG